MSHGPTTFPSKGCCIYCGTTKEALSREHIVPLSLGGQHVIEGASCGACADITKRFEQDVARELWGDARNSANAPSRRKKARPSHIVTGHPVAVTVPYSAYPPTFVFYTMPLPGILQGLDPATDVLPSWQLIAICDDKKLKEFSQTHNTQITARFRHVPSSFARLIAKIGYGHVLTKLDMSDFEPVVLPYILGKNANISYVVGGTAESAAPEPSLGYKLSMAVAGLAENAYVIAEVRLLANCYTPTYSVVVGRTTSLRNTEHVLQKLGHGELIINPS